MSGNPEEPVAGEGGHAPFLDMRIVLVKIAKEDLEMAAFAFIPLLRFLALLRCLAIGLKAFETLQVSPKVLEVAV